MDEPRIRTTWKSACLFGLAYLGCAEAGHWLSFHNDEGSFASIWPPGGLFLAALLIASRESWPRLILAATTANLLADVALHGQASLAPLGYCAANALEAVGAAIVLRKWIGGPPRIARLADLLKFIVVSVVMTALVGAVIGAATARLARGGEFLRHWAIWWSADLLGILAVAPVILAWSVDDAMAPRFRSLRRRIEFGLLLLVQAAVTCCMLWYHGVGFPAVRHPLLPFVLWIALRFGVRGMAVSFLLLSCQAVTITASGYGPFAIPGVSPEMQFHGLQLLLTVSGISLLVLATVTVERVTAHDEMHRRQLLLEAIHGAQSRFIGEVPLAEISSWLLGDLLRLTESDAGLIGKVLPEDDGTLGLKTAVCSKVIAEQEKAGRSGAASGATSKLIIPAALIDEALHTGRTAFGHEQEPAAQCLVAPFHFEGRVSGFVGLARRHGRFDPASVAFLEPLWTTCAHLLEMHRQQNLRQRAEGALRTSQARLEAAQSLARLGSWEYDTRSERSFWSPEIYRLTHYDPSLPPPGREESLQLIHPDDREITLRTTVDVLRHGGTVSFEFRTNPEKGPMRYLATTKERLELRSDGTARLAGVVQDVTERREAMLALQRSEWELADYFQHASIGLQRLALDGRILRANPAVLEMLGYSESEYVGREFSTILEDSIEGAELLSSIVSGEKLVDHEIRVRCRDGSTRDVLYSQNAYREEGAILHLRCFLVDVTELHRLEEQFHEAQKMDAIGRLAGGIAHDFNNLLTVINAHAGAILEGIAPVETHEMLIGEIRRTGEFAADLTSRLLTFSQRKVVRPGLIDLHEVIRGIQPMLTHLVRENIEFSVEREDNPLPVRADKGQLEQVLLNLVVNARDAMPRGGKLLVRSRRGSPPDGHLAADRAPQAGLWAELEVSDTGCGMDEAIQSRIFEPFFTTKPPGLGTGLGLSTVYGIIRQGQGRIDVISRPEEGSTFRIWLPSPADGADAKGAADEGANEPEDLCQPTQGVA
jgi:PAS domain S-box-containing protein